MTALAWQQLCSRFAVEALHSGSWVVILSSCMHPELQSVKNCTPRVFAKDTVITCWLSYAICSTHVSSTGVEGRAEAVERSFGMVCSRCSSCSCSCGPRHFPLWAMVQSIAVLSIDWARMCCTADTSAQHICKGAQTLRPPLMQDQTFCMDVAMAKTNGHFDWTSAHVNPLPCMLSCC